MSKSFNKTILDGRLTRDPEMSYTKGNTAICKFSIACNDDYKAADGSKVEKVSFFNVECWAKLAETMQKFLKKGSRVLVCGKLEQDRWVNDQNVNKSKVKITAQEINFLSPASENSGGNAAGASAESGGATPEPKTAAGGVSFEPSGNTAADNEVPF